MDKWGWWAVFATVTTVAVGAFVLGSSLIVGPSHFTLSPDAQSAVTEALALVFSWVVIAVIAVVVRSASSDDPITRLGQVAAIVGLLAWGITSTVGVLGLGTAASWVLLLGPGLFWMGILVMVAGRLTRPGQNARG